MPEEGYIRNCNCGSGKPSWWEVDARNIPLDRVCEDCIEKKLAKYRPEVLTDSQYDTYGEQVDEDY